MGNYGACDSGLCGTATQGLWRGDRPGGREGERRYNEVQARPGQGGSTASCLPAHTCTFVVRQLLGAHIVFAAGIAFVPWYLTPKK